ncbi:uncharacterized protein LOC143151769 isoform X1 [Ptiloglossa arizonensis]|uniref:uncharacterized protein LOC143151769 isoform X1 n=1 Tax=Ptiloglossa arizonensis TaxID=3350558 RepID=UPI003F9ED53D
MIIITGRTSPSRRCAKFLQSFHWIINLKTTVPYIIFSQINGPLVSNFIIQRRDHLGVYIALTLQTIGSTVTHCPKYTKSSFLTQQSIASTEEIFLRPKRITMTFILPKIYETFVFNFTNHRKHCTWSQTYETLVLNSTIHCKYRGNISSSKENNHDVYTAQNIRNIYFQLYKPLKTLHMVQNIRNPCS